MRLDSLLLIGLAAFLIVGCGTAPAPVHGAISTTEQDHSIQTKVQKGQSHAFHITSHGWHTGVVVPAADLFLYRPQLQARFPHRQYLEIGWGDAGFYQSESITIGITLQALFVPTTAVVHVVGFDAPPTEYFVDSDVRPLLIPTAAYQDLLSYLAQSFAVSPAEELTAQNKGIYGDSQFFTGVGQYTIMNTCNKWTAKALVSAGLLSSSRFKLTASSVMNSIAPRPSSPSAADSFWPH